MYLKDKPIKLFRDKGEKYRPVSLYLGNKKIAGYEYSEVTGESLSVLDTYNDDCSVTIKGESVQTATEQGVNLLDKIKIVNLALGTTILSGDTAWRGYYFTCKPNTLYSAKRVTPTTNRFVITFTKTLPQGYVEFFNSNPEIVSTNQMNQDVTVSSISPPDAKYVFLYFSNQSDVIPDTMLCEGVIQPYEPFVENSPSNLYRKEWYSSGNFDLVSSGKNWFDVNKVFVATNGATLLISIDNTGFTAIKGTDNNFVRFVLDTVIGDTYFVSYISNILVNWYAYSDSFFGTAIATFKPSGTSFVATTIKTYIGFYINNSTQNSVLTNIQLERDNATPYEPFRGLSTINFPYTLRSLPDGVADTITIRNDLKTTIAQPKLKTVTLSAGNEWTIADAKLNSSFRCTAIKPSNLVGNVLTSVEDITSEFQLTYELAVLPDAIPLDYEAVKTFYPQTNVYTNATVKPTLEGKFRVIGT